MMLERALAASVRDVDPCLASARALENVARASAGLPAEACAAYLECRASPASDQVDLLACVIDRADPSSRPDAGNDATGWSLAREVQRLRRTPGNVLHDESPLVWLEFDRAGASDVLPPPSVCVCVEPDYLSDRRYADRPACAAQHAAGEVSALAALPASTVERIARCVRNLPVEARLIHVSVMCARVDPVAKLYVRVPTAAAVDFLRRAGWDGDRRRLDRLLDARRFLDSFVHLDVTVDQGLVAPRLGVAFPRDTDGARFSHAVFEHLAQDAIDARDRELVQRAGDAWIANEPVVRVPSRGAFVVRRWIDQKLVLDGGAGELKLYLSVRPVPAMPWALATEEGTR